jgi:competence protein ComEC
MQADYLRDLLHAGQRWDTQRHMAYNSPRQWQWGRLHMTVLAPPVPGTPAFGAWTPRNENDRSLVLRLQYGTVRLLLTGDIERATESWLLTQGVDVRADILKVPHHGSKTSSTPAFVQQVQPRVGIISTGADNPFGHPHAQTLATLAHYGVEVWRTDVHGAVTLTSDGERYEIRAVRPLRPTLPAYEQAVLRQVFGQEDTR